jgi:hypothetical protein
MKKTLTAMLAVVLSVFSVITFADGLKPDSIVVYGGAYSKYVRTNGSFASPNSVFQGGVTFSWKNCMYLDLWGSEPFYRTNKNRFGSETDVTIGCKNEVGAMKFDVGIAHYNLYPLNRFNGGDVTDIFAEVAPKTAWQIGNGGSISPYLRMEVLSASAVRVNNAQVYYAGLRNNFSLTGKWSFMQQLQAGHQPTIPDVWGSGWVGYYKAEARYAVSEKLTANMSFQRYQPVHMDGGRTPSNVLGAGFVYKF